jgi:nucleoside-diphosphate-sugar epimerase
MAKLVAGMTGREALEPRFAAPRPGDVPHSLADLSRIRTALEYEPIVGLEVGLWTTLGWYAGASE